MNPQSKHTNGHSTKPPRARYVGEMEDEWDKNSVTKSYHRMRVDVAKQHVDELQKSNSEDSRVKLEKLEDDERRVMECRARISKNPSTKRLQDELNSSFREWWNEFKGPRRDQGIQELWNRRKEHVKPNICSESSNDTMGVGNDDDDSAHDDPDDPAHDMKAYFMFFEKDGQDWKGTTVHNQGFPEYEKFPNQRISIHTALHGKAHNPFKPTQDEKSQPHLRYIHIPANHMGVSEDVLACVISTPANNHHGAVQWVEVCLTSNSGPLESINLIFDFGQHAMARYHNEDGEDIVENRVKTNKTLSREFWKGQLHGSGPGRNPIHATHMRSRCSIIPGGMCSTLKANRLA